MSFEKAREIEKTKGSSKCMIKGVKGASSTRSLSQVAACLG